MRCVPRKLSLFFALVFCAATLPAQQAPNDFRWIDFHSSSDQDTIIWVNKALEAEKWTAIREIGVQFDAALVVTTLRATPQSLTGADTFSVFSVSLTNHMVTSLIKGVNLRLLDWMLFSVGRSRELGALFDDCTECNASTFFTAFYYDIRQHAWAARWLRGPQAAVPLSTPTSASGVAVSQVYALLAEPNGHELIGTWNHFDFGDTKPAEDYLYQYDVDPWSSLDRTQILSGKEADAMKKRLCSPSQVVNGLAHGQTSSLCIPTPKLQPRRRSASKEPPAKDQTPAKDPIKPQPKAETPPPATPK